MASYIDTLETSYLIKTSIKWPLLLMAIDFLVISVKSVLNFCALHDILLPLLLRLKI